MDAPYLTRVWFGPVTITNLLKKVKTRTLNDIRLIDELLDVIDTNQCKSPATLRL